MHLLFFFHTGCAANTTSLAATNQTRSLQTPYFPAFYPANLLCTWLITAPPDHVVVLHFKLFNLENTFDCEDDYFLVRDGPNSTSPVLVKLCGAARFCPVSSSGRYMWIQFISGERWVFPGINVTYTAVSKELMNGNPGPVALWENNTTIKASNDYRQKVAPSACIWNISVPHGQVISFRITVTNTYSTQPTICIIGYVDVIDGPNLTSPRIKRVCNGLVENPVHVTSSGSHVVVRFVSSQTGARMDFQASTFKELETDHFGCSSSIPVNVTSDDENITSPFHPQYYPNNQQCQWRITAPKNYHIILRFQEFDLAQPGDFVEIRDGLNASAALMGNFVRDPGFTKSLASTGRFLWVRFKSNHENVATGFVLSFKFVPSLVALKNITLVVSNSSPKNQQPNNVITIIGAALGSCVLIVIASILFVLVRKKKKEILAR
ncbi:tolloid-like protein 2 [Actinia tenebrosa]|uniref:Tolloid-like protein 2 n=1 Tax=Actinia tenebrosa TaxID=6105 RepID=A0A6P8HX18_ACTTE|nr:tolloid-like protein 2 [Actinia tenebrosa]